MNLKTKSNIATEKLITTDPEEPQEETILTWSVMQLYSLIATGDSLNKCSLSDDHSFFASNYISHKLD